MKPTRGQGRLEEFISKRRMSMVMRNIPPSLHQGEVLDIGCGSYPLFLLSSPFRRKVGVDQIRSPWSTNPPLGLAELEFHQLTLSGSIRLPFPDASFGCVTSLACIEHMEPASLPSLFLEIHRVLKPAGTALITTPHALAEKPLRLLAKFGMVSKEEIEEHKSLFRHRAIFDLFMESGFEPEKVKVRGFQLGLNILGVAVK